MDENLTRNACSSQAGCQGIETCVSGGYVCQFQAGSRRTCWELASACPGATAECRADGTSGPCQPASPGTEDCNSCDDDHDGTVDNVPGQPMGSLNRECSNSSGVCPGASRSCAVRYTNGGAWLDNAWGECVAPPETCNGLDDDCDDVIDDVGVCDAASVPVCCTPIPKATACGSRTCGGVPDGCGGTYDCGTCPAGSACQAEGFCCSPGAC